MIDVSRLQLGRPLEIDRRPLDLVALLRRLVTEHEHAGSGHHIRLLTAMETLSISGDALRLERAVTNLLANAVKYSPGGTTIAVTLARRVDPAGAWATIGVADQGIGIAEEDLPRVFDLFYRGGNAAALAPGSGLGLAGVRQVVAAHGGTVEIASERGKGTTVSIQLPLAPNPPI